MVTKELSYILQLKFQHNISYDTVRKRKIDYNGTKIDQKVIKPFSIVNRNMNLFHGPINLKSFEFKLSAILSQTCFIGYQMFNHNQKTYVIELRNIADE